MSFWSTGPVPAKPKPAPTFEGQLHSARALKLAIAAMQGTVEAVSLDVRKKGLLMQVQHTSSAYLMHVLLPAKDFATYQFPEDQEAFNMGIRLAGLAKALDCAGDDDRLTLIKVADGTDVLTLVVDSADGARHAQFDLKLMHVESHILGIPEYERAAEMHIPSEALHRICRNLARVGDDMRLRATPGQGVKFSVRGRSGTANVTCRHTAPPPKPPRPWDYDCDMDSPPSGEKNTDAAADIHTTIIHRSPGVEPVTLWVQLAYLQTFTKAMQGCGKVKLSFCEGVPLEVVCPLGATGSIKLCVAPRILSEEEPSPTAHKAAGAAGFFD